MKRFRRARDIKVGVIGYSGAFGMGKIHLDEMKQAGMTPTAVTELDARRRKAAQEEFPDIEAVQKHAEDLMELDWYRYIEGVSILGTEWEG